jgi:prepilin-type N-terminal cleavage/methylation domain-containing protein
MKRGFSLIEIMVTVTLLAVIILGLVTMFNQTQRAMAYGMNQADALAAGRTAGEMLSRELEQVEPAPNGRTTFWSTNTGTNVWALPTLGPGMTTVVGSVTFHLGYQPGDSNRLGRLVSYQVNADSNGIGPLLRYESTLTSTNTNTVLEGVTAFRAQTLDRMGQPDTNVFTNGVAPLGVALELAVLEGRTLAQYQALSNNPAAAKQFLTNQAGHLHVFRQRVGVRAGQ